METNFTTKLEGTDISVFGLETYVNRKQNHDIDAVAVIDWYLYQEHREWGIKSLDCNVSKLAIELTINWWNDDDSIEQKTLTIETGYNSDDDWKITEDIDVLEFGGEIHPFELEIDFDLKEIMIKF